MVKLNVQEGGALLDSERPLLLNSAELQQKLDAMADSYVPSSYLSD